MIPLTHVVQLRVMSSLAARFPRESLNVKLSHWMQKYEDFVGLTEVKLAQSRVLNVSIVVEKLELE